MVNYATDIAMLTLKEKPENEKEKREEVHQKMKEVFAFENEIAKVCIHDNCLRYVQTISQCLSNF